MMKILQNVQTSQLLLMNIKSEYLQTLLKCQAGRLWVKRPSGLIKRGRKYKHFKLR